MSNSTTTQTQENPMDHYSLIESLFNDFISSGGSPKVTEFKKHVDQLIKDKIKPLCSGRGKSAQGGTGWRSELKARFSGRGAKWVRVETEEMTDTLARFEIEGFDTANYRNWIEAAGYAWIRFSGPRIWDGKHMAAFEVRTTGSTFDCPKQLHYIVEDSLDDKIKLLGGTPHAMKLEWVHNESVTEEHYETCDKPDVATEAQSDVPVSEETPVEEVKEVVNEAPTSDDPEEWEAFLQAEGLGLDDDLEEDDIFGEL